MPNLPFIASFSTLSRTSAIKDFSKVFSGNIFSQILIVAATPLITRLFPPEAFGCMSYISSWIGVLAVVSCLSYDKAIILPKNEEAALNLVVLSFMALGSIVAIELILLLPITNLLDGHSIYSRLFWIIPFGVLFTGLKDIMYSLSTRACFFSALAIAEVVAAIMSICFKTFYGFFIYPDAKGLLFGNIAGLAAGILLLIAKGWPKIITLRESTSLRAIREQARLYDKFPKYASLNGLLNMVSQNLPIFMLGMFFSPETVGFYALGNAVLRRPIQTVGSSVSRVFIQRASVYQAQEKDVRPILAKTTMGLAAVGVLPFSVLMAFGDALFVYAFGPEWKTAGVYCRILAPWLFMGFINPPATQIILVKQDLKFRLLLMAASIGLRAAAIVLGVFLYDSILVSLVLFSAVGVAVNAVYIQRAFALCRS